jgi:hypothetical protein
MNLPIVLEVEKLDGPPETFECVLLEFRDAVGLKIKLTEAMHPLEGLCGHIAHYVVAHL